MTHVTQTAETAPIIPLWLRRDIRTMAGASRTMPITVEPGDAAPHIVGESYYWTWTANPAGKRVWSSRGRGLWRTYYWPSTRCLIVGAEWVAAQLVQRSAETAVDEPSYAQAQMPEAQMPEAQMPEAQMPEAQMPEAAE